MNPTGGRVLHDVPRLPPISVAMNIEVPSQPWLEAADPVP
jgi:hypothetical protein